MKGAKRHNNWALKNLCRTIEARFTSLADSYGIEQNFMRSKRGFWLKTELTVLVYNLSFFSFDEKNNYHELVTHRTIIYLYFQVNKHTSS